MTELRFENDPMHKKAIAAKKRLGWEKQDDADDIWKRNVEEAKIHVATIRTARFKIAKLAVEACDIRWGGGYHWEDNPQRNTLKDFAREIGVNFKTLHNWVSVYRFAKAYLVAGDYDEVDYDKIKKAKTEVGPSNLRRLPVKQATRKARDAFNKQKQATPFEHAAKKFIITLKKFSARFCQSDLAELTDDDLGKLRSHCEMILYAIKEHSRDKNDRG